MARPSVVVVCTNVAQAGRIAQGLGTRHGLEGSTPHHDPRSSRTTRHEHKGSTHHRDLSGPHATRHGRERPAHHRNLSGPRPATTTPSGRARSSTAVRLWKVYEGDTLYAVHDLGTHLEARSEDGGAPVWTGVGSPSGGYKTRSTTFPEHALASFLAKVHDGDETTPRAQVAPASARHAAPASGKRAAKRSSTAPPRKPAAEAHPEVPRAERSTATPKKRGRPKKAKPAASARPKSKAPASVKPKSKAPASAKPKGKAPASAKPKSKSAAHAKPKPPPKAKAKRQPATKAAASGPQTSRSPVSTHVTPASMRRHLQAKDPESPEEALATLEDIWRGGASEPTRAWMIAKGFTDLADAFVDWVAHHTTEANGYMRAARAQRSA